MSTTVPPITSEAIATSTKAMLVLTGRGVLAVGLGVDDVALDLPALVLLERISRGATSAAEVPALIGAVAEEVGGDPDALTGLLDQLVDARVLQRLTEPVTPEPAPRIVAGAAETTPSVVVFPVPVVLGLRDGRYELWDHEGRVVGRLTAVELEASRSITTPVALDAAFESQREALGPLALDEAAFSGLVRRLVATGLVQQYDGDAAVQVRGYDRDAETLRREIRGKWALQRVLERERERLDAIETERRSRTGVARPKVLPVHSIATSWRNPPLSLGLVLAAAQAHEDGALLDQLDIRPDWLIDLDVADRYAAEPAIYLFSNYVWSSQQNLAISARVKELSPDSVTVHGGPDVPKYEIDVERYFAEHPHVDVVVHGEGEVTGPEVLAALAGHVGRGPLDLSGLAEVAGITYRTPGGLVRTADRERLTDLDSVPSPYLAGIFDAYVEAWRAIAETELASLDGWGYLQPVVVLETNRGCPYGCTFCDWGSSTLSRIRKYSMERIFAELEWCAENRVDTVGLADANFGIFERDVEITEKVAELKKHRGFPRQFGTNYAKNTVKHLRRIVEVLSDADILSYGLLSLQAMDETTLSTIKRSNIKLDKYEQLAAEFQRARLPLYVDLMVGLPGQTVASFRRDMQECANREVHAKIFQTQLLVNSPMNAPEYREAHGIRTTPGALVLETATFTRDDYEHMLTLRELFYTFEKFGVLRYVARHVRKERGVPEVDFFERMWTDVAADPGRWPVLAFSLVALPRFMVPPTSWKEFLRDVRSYVVDVLGVPDDSALDTVVQVQWALLPDRSRTFPASVELTHDFEAWHAAMLDAKHHGHLDDWPDHTPDLRSFGPSTMEVGDSRGVCEHELGRHVIGNPWDSWDLDASVCRAVTIAK